MDNLILLIRGLLWQCQQHTHSPSQGLPDGRSALVCFLQHVARAKTHELCSLSWCLWVLLPIFEERSEGVAEPPGSLCCFIFKACKLAWVVLSLDQTMQAMPCGFRCEVKQCKRKYQWQSAWLVWTKKTLSAEYVVQIASWALALAEQVQLSLETEFGNTTSACSHPQKYEYFARAVPFAAESSEGSQLYNLGTSALSAACAEESCSWLTVAGLICHLWGSQLGAPLSVSLSFTHQLILFQESMSCLSVGSGGIMLCLSFLLGGPFTCRWNSRYGI